MASTLKDQDQDPTNILIYGLGAIGSFYAFILDRARSRSRSAEEKEKEREKEKNIRLTVVARSNYDVVKKDGLRVFSERYGEGSVRPWEVVKSPAEATTKIFDYVICATKAIDLERTAEELDPVVISSRGCDGDGDEDGDEGKDKGKGEKTTIVIIQNGVGNEDVFRERFPGNEIISCVTWVGASQPSPGIIHHGTSENTQMGIYLPPLPPPMNNDDDDDDDDDDGTAKARESLSLDRFANLLRRGGTPVEVFVDKDVQVARWEKVVWNAAWNSLTTLTDLDTHSWLDSSVDAEPLTRKLMGEVISVAQASGVGGIDGDGDLVDRLMEKIKGMESIGSSMQVDRRNGRPMEVEVILGHVVRKGRELGVGIGVLETVYVLLGGINRRFLGEE
ncbi:2-dehydropantoate 2-reductase [Poronia punctata]|nr:2-dehydropantoate 2-reductase [Poronia punctata]